MRILLGYDNGIPYATITSSKEEIDNQFWYPRRNRVIKEYKDVKDNYSWSSEDDSVSSETEPSKNDPPPRIYDLRTPLKESKRTDCYEEILLYDATSEIGKRTKGSLKSIKATTTSVKDSTFTAQTMVSKPSKEMSLVELILMEEKARSKCAEAGELHCYKSLQSIFEHQQQPFATKINDTLMHFQQEQKLQATQWLICFIQKWFE